MKKLTITYLDLDDIKNPLLAAGQATATFGVASQLVKKGHKVTVIASRYPGYKDRFESGIYYKHIGPNTKNIKFNNLMYIFLVPFFVKTITSDIIVECFTAPVSTLLSPLFTKIPVVGLPSMFNAKQFSKKYHLPFYLIEKYGARLYKYFMPYSDVDSKKMLKLNPSIEYRIIPQGVGTEYTSLKKRKGEYILFLGRFDIDQKGIDLLIESYAKVKNTIAYPLYIAGHGPDEDKIKKLINQYKLEKHVKIVGSLYGEKKLEIMKNALFVAFPSRHDELSLWSLEALAAGLPLVCFDLPEYKWLGTKAILKAKAFDTTAYAKKLVKATEPKENSMMSREAKQLAKKYTWESVASKFESFFYEIVQKEIK